jgi:cysteine protease ATG4
MSSAAAVALDTAVAGAADLGRYGRRIVRMIWDPEPTNDTTGNLPVWCLGCSYVREVIHAGALQEKAATTPPPDSDASAQPVPSRVPDTPPDSVSSSFSSSLAYEEHGDDGGWPAPFVDDFEARIWMTYRSGFVPIARSTDPRSLVAMSFSMRLKSLGDQAGFSSDSGWGCMIRSGQSLLANALAVCELGRGTLATKCHLLLSSHS